MRGVFIFIFFAAAAVVFIASDYRYAKAAHEIVHHPPNKSHLAARFASLYERFE